MPISDAVAVALLGAAATLPARDGVAAAPELSLVQGVAGYAGAADASVYRDRPDNTNGGAAVVFAGSTVNSVRRALLRFDLSGQALPPPPREATLTLVLERSGLFAGTADGHSLHRATTAWTEGSTAEPDPNIGGQGVAAQPGDVTWNSAAHGTTTWTNPGGDFEAVASAALAVARWDSVVPANNVYTFEGEGLAADIDFWEANPSANHGWFLLGNEVVARNARRFHSSEAADVAVRPVLTIRSTAASAAESWEFYD